MINEIWQQANAKIHSSFGLMVGFSIAHSDIAQFGLPQYRTSISCPDLVRFQIRSRFDIVPFEDRFWDWPAMVGR